MILAATLTLYFWLAVTLWRSITTPMPKTAAEFYSFGMHAEPSALRKAFFVTNASFGTAFVSLFLFVHEQGVLSFATPLSFVAGVWLYGAWFIPRQITLLSDGRRYPELLEISTGSRVVRGVVSMYVGVSLWMFIYTEIQAFSTFLSVREVGLSQLSLLSGMMICIVMAIYTARSGLVGVIASDKLQYGTIAFGGIALIILFVDLVWRGTPSASPSATPLSIVDILLPGSLTVKGSILLLVEVLAGFLLSQIVYYDNWQRISAYIRVRSASSDISKHELQREVSNAYIGSIPSLLALYSLPLILAIIMKTKGWSISSPNDIADFLAYVWRRDLASKALLIVILSYFSCALISTIEVYAASLSNSITDDVFRFFNTDDADSLSLTIARTITFGVCTSFIPVLIYTPSFDWLFLYLFSSANALVGPLTALTLGREVSPWRIYVNLFIGISIPLYVQVLPQHVNVIPFPSTFVVVFSLATCLLPKRLLKNG